MLKLGKRRRDGQPHRFRREFGIVAAAVLLVLSPPRGLPEASAGTLNYVWGAVSGHGQYVTFPDYQVSPFRTSDGGLSIHYNPDDLLASSVDISTGPAGYDLSATLGFTISATDAGVAVCAYGREGESAYAFLPGDPGPLNLEGNPESLDSLVDAQAIVAIQPGYHEMLTFYGQTVPEPSSLATLALGLTAVALTDAARRRKKRSAGSQ